MPRQFATADEQVDFVSTGSVRRRALRPATASARGRMPGFGDNPNTEEVEGDGMMSEEMIRAIAGYEANLPGEATTSDAPGGTDADRAAGDHHDHGRRSSTTTEP